MLQETVCLTAIQDNITIRGTYQSVPHSYQFVTDNKTAVNLGCPAVHDLRDINPIVTGYVLISNSTCDTEAQTLVSLYQLDFDQLCVTSSSNILKEE